jgi:hypothetical protein
MPSKALATKNTDQLNFIDGQLGGKNIDSLTAREYGRHTIVVLHVFDRLIARDILFQLSKINTTA